MGQEGTNRKWELPRSQPVNTLNSAFRLCASKSTVHKDEYKNMMPVRIHNNAKGSKKVFWAAVVMVAVGLLFFPTLNGWPHGWGQVSHVLGACFGCVFLGGLLFLLLLGPRLTLAGFAGPSWIEIGDHFVYANGRGVKTLDWTDIRAIQFEYTNIYQGDDPLPHDSYNTYLKIVLVRGKRLDLCIGCPTPCAANLASVIADKVVEGLQASKSERRRIAAEILGRFGPAGISYLRKNAINGEHDGLRKDATEALQAIERVLPILHAATMDSDDGVTRAANDALRRLENPEST
jgi:hypothetical protein